MLGKLDRHITYSTDYRFLAEKQRMLHFVGWGFIRLCIISLLSPPRFLFSIFRSGLGGRLISIYNRGFWLISPRTEGTLQNRKSPSQLLCKHSFLYRELCYVFEVKNKSLLSKMMISIITTTFYYLFWFIWWQTWGRWSRQVLPIQFMTLSQLSHTILAWPGHKLISGFSKLLFTLT